MRATTMRTCEIIGSEIIIYYAHRICIIRTGSVDVSYERWYAQNGTRNHARKSRTVIAPATFGANANATGGCWITGNANNSVLHRCWAGAICCNSVFHRIPAKSISVRPLLGPTLAFCVYFPSFAKPGLAQNVHAVNSTCAWKLFDNKNDERIINACGIFRQYCIVYLNVWKLFSNTIRCSAKTTIIEWGLYDFCVCLLLSLRST